MKRFDETKIDIIKEKGRQFVDSKWFDLTMTGLTLIIPCASGRMISSSRRALPYIGKMLNYAPPLINSYFTNKKTSDNDNQNNEVFEGKEAS